MSILYIVFIVLGVGIAGYLLFHFLRIMSLSLYNQKRSFDMVFLQVKISKKESKEDKEDNRTSGTRDFKEVMGVATHLFEALHSIHSGEFKNKFIDEDYFSLEYAMIDNEIFFYVVIPRSIKSLVEKQITAFYPDSYVEQVDDYSIFKPNSKIAAASLSLVKPYYYSIRTAEELNSDPINNITNVLSKLGNDSGASIQIIAKPVGDGWQDKGRDVAKEMFKGEGGKKKFKLNPLSWISVLFDFFIKGEIGEGKDGDAGGAKTTPMTDEEVKIIEKKNSKVGYEFIIRVISAASSQREADSNLGNMISAFVQYSSPKGNGFYPLKYQNKNTIVKNYILRSSNKHLRHKIKKKKDILSVDELASLYHFPSVQYNQTPNIVWQDYKVAPAPHNIPKDGILLGYNTFRGEKKEIRMKNEDRFRHFYIIGQTGTGKSSIMQVMLRQDFRDGKGVAVIDPHGSLIEDILPFIPKERADDVIYFNPGDTERPLGLNLLEGGSWEEKEYVAMEAMNIMIKLFNEEIFGPRIQDYFRNGCLTLMADPEGGALTDIVRLFTDDDYQKVKVKHVTNPVVRSFWENQMAKTGAREKQEMIPYFAAKFGQFVTNGMMRNIIGQAKSAFDFADVMKTNKILLINLSKGQVGEINSRLLGLIIVSKLQMAALARQNLPKEDRKDFFLYIDEFQNYITDSIEIILSEARKYRLGLTMAHQYIAQLEGKDGKSKVKDAVFGNVGTIMSYKIGAQDAEYMSKEMAPVFGEQDLINLDKFKAVMKLSIDTQPSKPFSITPVNAYLETGDPDVAEAYKQLSRLKYGRDREFVDKEILRRIGAV